MASADASQAWFVAMDVEQKVGLAVVGIWVSNGRAIGGRETPRLVRWGSTEVLPWYHDGTVMQMVS